MRENSVAHSILLAVTAAIVPWSLQAVEEPVFTAITDSPISESYAFSAAWGDYDGDGFLDLLFVDPFQGVRGQTQIYLFTNKRDGTFEKRVLDAAQFPHDGYLNGALWGDYDNDGRLDILVNGGGTWTGADRSVLLHQGSDGSFSTTSSPSFPVGVSHSGLWADFDGDGLLDIFAGYWTDGSLAVSDILWRNNGNGTFADSKAPGINQLNDNNNSAMAATTGDFNGDGHTDIIVTTINQGRSRLYLNNGNVTFERVMVTPSVADYYGNGIAAADYDNDGDLDFLTVSKSGDWGWTCACDGSLSGYSKLWRNNGSGGFEQVVAGELGNTDTIGANGAAWADYDNDGWLDVIMIRGAYSNGRGHDPSDLLYRNNGDGTFSRVLTGTIATEDGDARAGAWADYDNDGDMDLVLANYNWAAPGGSDRFPVLYRNEGNQNHWLTLRLIGTSGNRDAIGAKVRVRATIGGQETWQLREIRANTGWIAAQNDMRPHYGMGDATVAELVRIEWPSGIVQELTNVPADQILTVVESVRLTLDARNRLAWHSSNAREFTLESASSVNGPWTSANDVVEADGNLRTATIETGSGNRFYRLQNTPPVPIPPNPNPDTLVWMTPGTFLMGSPQSEPEREPLVPTTGYGDETLHQVTLSEGFWISRLETTQPEFQALMGSNPSLFTGTASPLDSATWHEAVAYCEALTAQEEAGGRLPEGYVYRLPTEAEWEYACRAGTSTVLYTGNELRSRQATFDGTREYSVAEGGTVANPAGAAPPRPLSVGLTIYPRNAWGLSDMMGNVSEWCLDRMDHSPDGPVTDLLHAQSHR